MELAEERAYLDRVRRALAWMLDHARMRVATGEDVAGDRYTAETLGRMLKSYAKELAEEPPGAPFFGKLSFADGHRYYLGRRRVVDERGEPLVIDWRAPVSALFYRASPRDRQGVSVRRRFGWSSRPPVELTGFEDERLDHGEELGGASRLLTAEIERPRVGPMRDIVATIQPEQDELVRAELDRSLCVQGAPGTGKTAVGLHRAAYLLYTHRHQLQRTGVLVVGPNPAFLEYISAVLPALGEVDVLQRTLAEVLGDRAPRGTDGERAAAIKHDVRMAQVLGRALDNLLRSPAERAEGIVLPDGSYRLRVPAVALLREFRQVRAEGLPYGVGRERWRTRIVALLQRQLEHHGESPTRKWLDKTSRARPVTEVLDACWPRVRPEELLTALFSDPAALARAAGGILGADEQAALLWARPPRTFKSAPWSAADLVLLDELAGAIGHPPGFGHIVVDEAQDLSPMQCRVLARRSRHGSLTVLGDLAQGTSPWAATNWHEQVAHLGKPGTPVTALTAGFRVPAVVLDFANQLLPHLGVDVPVARSVRRDGELRLHPTSDLIATTESCIARTREGSVAVIAADDRAAALPDLGPRITVVPATQAKGLEFDHVVVVEPREIAEPGLRLLYVALTRAVSRLDLVHSTPLPEELPAL
ncbi:HelD family protein [Actinoplanes sp. RD1]|uniref:HelD family protein n=1 Tax=Actinoplanes sp. RD1 TaxID=3064538 RepID=UPI0027407D52|nr:ATP-binding domain-containing protein [Actinoplanes sp. RD1]